MERTRRMGAVRTPGVYPPSLKLHAGWPMPLMTSTKTQSHANVEAEGQFLRIGQRKHHTPNARSPTLIARNPDSWSDEMRPVKNLAGGKDSQSRPKYSSIECAA